jgi:hypothetical protein
MPDQLSRRELDGLDADAIVKARREGRLDNLLGVPAEQVELMDRARNGVISRADVQELAKLGRHDLIVAAHKETRIKGE